MECCVRYSALFSALLFLFCVHAQPLNRPFISGPADPPIESCLSAIATLYFNKQSTLGIIDAQNLNASREKIVFDSFIRGMHDSALWSMINLESRKCPIAYFYRNHEIRSNETVVRVDNLIISGDAEGVVSFAENCDLRILCSEKSRLVVLVEDDGVQKVLNAFWTLDKLDVIVLVGNSQAVDIYSLFPFDHKTRPVWVDTFSQGDFREGNNLFPDKTENLKGFQVTFGAVQSAPFVCRKSDGTFIGFEVNIVKTLSKLMNFTVRYNFVGLRFTSWEETLVSLRLGRCDVTLGGFLERPDRFHNFGQTTTFFRDSVDWFVGGDWTISAEWRDDVFSFNGITFLVFIISMHFISVRGRNQLKHQSTGITLLLVCVQIYALFVESPTRLGHFSWRQKFLWALCAFYCLNMNALIKSVITSVMTQPLYDSKVKTVRQLYESEVPIMHFSPNNRGTTDFPDVPNQDLARIAKRTVSCPESDMRGRTGCLSDKLAQGPISITIIRAMMEVLMKNSPRGTFHTLDKSIGVFQMISYTRKNHFLLPAFRRHMRRLLEVGLVEHWHVTFKLHSECDVALAKWRQTDGQSDSAYRPVAFQRIEDVLWPLFVGYGLSCLVFWVEVFGFRWGYTWAAAAAFFRRKMKGESN